MREFGAAFLRFCRDLLAHQTIIFALTFIIVVAAGRGIVGEPAVFYLAPPAALLASFLPWLVRWERRRRGSGA